MLALAGLFWNLPLPNISILLSTAGIEQNYGRRGGRKRLIILLSDGGDRSG
jgi:hypothetical protein